MPPPTERISPNRIPARLATSTLWHKANAVPSRIALIKAALGKKGPGVFVVPGLMKIIVVQKAAVPARKGINPFTKQEQMFKAKPARRVVKVRPLKALKDMAK